MPGARDPPKPVKTKKAAVPAKKDVKRGPVKTKSGGKKPKIVEAKKPLNKKQALRMLVREKSKYTKYSFISIMYYKLVHLACKCG